MMQSTALFPKSHYFIRARERLGLNRKAATATLAHVSSPSTRSPVLR